MPEQREPRHRIGAAAAWIRREVGLCWIRTIAAGSGPGRPRRRATTAASSAARSFVPITPSAGRAASSAASASASSASSASMSGPANLRREAPPGAAASSARSRRTARRPALLARPPARPSSYSAMATPALRSDPKERIARGLEEARARTLALLEPIADAAT